MFDTKSFSLVKAVSWRLIATGTTMGIAYGVTGEHSVAMAIGALELTIKLVLYYLHERIWNCL